MSEKEITGNAKAESRKAGNAKAESREAGNAQAKSSKAGSAQAERRDAGSAKAESSKAGSAQAESRDAGSAKAESREAGNAQAKSREAGNAQAKSREAGNAKAESRKAGSAKAESGKAGSSASSAGAKTNLKSGEAGSSARSTEAKTNLKSREAGSAQAEHRDAGNAKAESSKAGSAQSKSSKAGSSQAKSGEAGNAQAKSREAGSSQAKSGKAGNAKAESREAGNAQAKSSKAGNTKAERRKAGSAQAKSRKTAKKGKKPNSGNHGIDQKSLIDQIVKVMSRNPRQPFNYKQLASRLHFSDKSEKRALSEALLRMKKDGLAEEYSHGKYLLKSTGGYVSGTIDLTKFGYAFVVSDETDDDIFIAARNLNTALHGDRVKVHLYARHKGRRPEGEVVEIISRSRAAFVGVVEINPHFAFLIPDNKKMPFDLFIPLTKLNGAKQGEKAVAKLVEWDQRSRNPIGEITEVLGNPGENETEMHAILAEFGLPARFDAETLAAAEKIETRITGAEIAARRDFRDVPTFTIDPEDAKDFDDALSVRVLPDGNIEAGIHIADVTHYIRPGSPLEKVAQERATSVYLVDRTIPMLPERLSNQVCSLNPSEDKLTYSAIFVLDNKGKVISEWFGRTVIRSDRRFSYSEAQLVLDTGQGDMREELLILDNLAQQLRARRFASGSFSFERLEVQFRLSETGVPLGILFREYGTANQLIEEFMLLANRRVAEYVGKQLRARSFVYRIHDKPDPEKLSSFGYFIKRFGYDLDTGNVKSLPRAMNRLMEQIAGRKEQNVIETLALRSMAKAIYSTDNIGHFGLAFSHYTHFTSPIRRYPDMMVHRLLTQYLEGQQPHDAEKLAALCEHSSKMERLATDAERASVKYKQVEFMSDKIGEEFEGIISGVTEWGIYVEIIENQCEGMIAIRELQDDFFEYDEENYCIRGRHSGRVYMLGDKVRVEVAKADLQKRQLDYRLV